MADAPAVRVGPFPFREAIAFLRDKLDIPTEHWDDMRGEPHANGFTVAGATKIALLGDLHAAVNQAIEDGQSIGEFRKGFDKIIQEHGWTYRGKRGWRTRVIYDTNLRTAHAAGRWKQIVQSARDQQARGETLYLQYLTVGDARVRPEHAQWHEIILPVDHPFWDTHYPPNGWGCRCIVRVLTERQLERQGLKSSKAPQIVRTERVNTRSGEVYGEVPEGIDVGWDYHVGKAWLRHDRAGGLRECTDNTADHARGTRCFPSAIPGQRTWKDHGRPALRDVPRPLTLKAPPLLPAPTTRDEALGMYRGALGMTERRVRRFETPAGLVILHDEFLGHLTQNRKRARFAAFIEATLRTPYEVWATEFPDGIRRHYIAVFRGEEAGRRSAGIGVTRVNTDGSLFWTWFRGDPANQDSRRQGGLIYSR